MAAIDADAILAQVRRWARARNGLRAGLGGTAAALAATLAGRAVGSLPADVWLGVPALALVGWGWPLSWERLLLRAGRRLGVGERLAAADVLTRHEAPALLGPLLGEIAALRRRMWRLLLGPMELGAAALALCLALAVGFVPLRSRSPAVIGRPPPDAALMETVAPPEPTPDEPRPEPPDAVPSYPAHADAPMYSPYQDLLAAVLGLDGDLAGGLLGEELTARLAQEEGLLRQLAERIAAAAPGGLSPTERAELVPLAQEVARADLRERLQRLLDREDEAAAREAADAVTAVIEAADRASEGDESGPGSGESPGTGSGVTAQRPVLGEGTDAGTPEPNGINGHDRFDEGGEISDIAGTAAGDPLGPGTAGEWGPTQGAEAPTAVGAGEGPMRAYVVPGIPGEPPATTGSPAALSPQEVDVILRARGIPAELRDLVRRYFELIGGYP
ncbi:MAG: hypothetical protein ABID40_03520 [Candidatus Bipolaricaulota bacterium]